MNDSHFQGLLDLYIDGGLDAPELVEFEGILLSDQAARVEFWRQSQLHHALRRQADEGRGELVAQDFRKQRLFTRGRLAVAAAVVAAAVIGVWSQIPRSSEVPLGDALAGHAPPASELTSLPEMEVGAVAVISELAEAEWAGARPFRKGEALEPGELMLRSGKIGLTFFNGAHVTVEGPALLKILSESSMVLTSGEVRIECPEVAHGFTVITPNGRVVDLGTVFSLSVGDEGSAEVRVVKGLVSMRGNTEQEDVEIRERGVATIDTKGHVHINDKATPLRDQEITESIRINEQANFKKWREASDRRVDDKDLLIYLRMLEGESAMSKTLLNEGGSEAASATAAVISGDWVSGRWPGKRALSFHSAADRARVEIDGGYPQVTFLAWVKISNFQRPFNALFMSDRAIEGQVYWQFSKTGGSRFSTLPTADMKKRRKMGGTTHRAWDEDMLRPSDNGLWRHIATSYDADQQLVIHYLDGKEVGRHTLPEHIPLFFGNATIGNTSYAKQEAWGTRQFGGAVDELALYSKVLGPDLIAAFYEEGRPD